MSKAHWVALAMTGRIGGKTMTRLLKSFNTADAIVEAAREELMRVPHIGEATATAIKQIDMSRVEAMCADLTQQNIVIITWNDGQQYPGNLLKSDDAPPVLFVRGAFEQRDTRAVAIVGTREPRRESADLAHALGCELAARGWTIVSGLALGIDAAAHRGALASDGRTLAVLGCGLRRLYPPAHQELAAQIAGHGALLSELHPDEPVSAQTLIARNRITSGLSRAVIVVQSGEDSGSMSTARRARQQGRGVFAVLGGDTGCDALLASGAEPLQPHTIDYDELSARLDSIQM
jgi:DNA processing protein